jgi:hypothetical protein
MQKYINATRDHVVGICDMIKREEGLSGQDDLRVAVGLFLCLGILFVILEGVGGCR